MRTFGRVVDVIYMLRNGPATYDQLITGLGHSKSSIERVMRALKEGDLVEFSHYEQRRYSDCAQRRSMWRLKLTRATT